MMSKHRNLVVALGNPGKQYLLTAHNIGWIVVDSLAHSLNKAQHGGTSNKNGTVESPALRGWHTKKKLSALLAFYQTPALLLAKPLTYMNLSGLAVRALLNYYQLELSKLLVIHDDIDLPFLSIRFQKNRGSAGHNGIKSIHKELGSQDYARMRIGMRPMPLDSASSSASSKAIIKRDVLKSFSKREQALLPDFLNKAVEALLYFAEEGFEKTANRYNQSQAPS